jgi:erythronate-4-phosphate dehydrogenase
LFNIVAKKTTFLPKISLYFSKNQRENFSKGKKDCLLSKFDYIIKFFMNLIVDENIAFAKEAFSSLGNTQLVDGRKLSNADVKDADILVVRSITNVNADLLKDSKIKFVGTATIGIDHIELEYLRRNNISFADARGCNADSVAEYVFTALLKVASTRNIFLREKTIGVVGIGNIGNRVVRIAEAFGMKVLKNDPPLERNGIGKNYVSLDEVLKSDIITFHVPMNLAGPDKTFHLLNSKNLNEINKGSIIINTSRGAVIDNKALLEVSNNKEFEINLDVWENEPAINAELLAKTSIGTPHIAGYSFEGKVNGTKIIYDALCKFLDKEPIWTPSLPEIEMNEIKMPSGNCNENKLYKLFSSIYNIGKDDELMRRIIQLEETEQANYFDSMRKNYPIRREFSNFTVILEKKDLHLKSILESLRFKTKIN